MEFASGNGNEERDSTPILMTDEGDVQKPSKFWVYEQIIRIPYYGIYEMSTDRLEVYHLRDLSDKKLFLGIPAGILAAVRKNSWVDNLTMSGAFIGVSLPVYWLGLMLIYLFAVYLKWLPPNGRISVDLGFGFKPITGVYALDALLRLNWAVLRDAIAHLILPALTLGTIPLAIIARITRYAMLEVLSQDYIRTARAKGLPEYWVILKHALKNAFLPIVTIIGLQFGTLLGGAILIETIFSWPGIGSWIYNGILTRDYPSVQGGVIFVAVNFVLINLLVDIFYAFFTLEFSIVKQLTLRLRSGHRS